MPSFLKRQAGCLVSAVTFLLCLAAVEVYVRIAYPQEDIFALTGRLTMPDPMSAWAVTDAFCAYRPIPGYYDAAKTVDSFGFISTPEITLEKPQGTLRILFLGESSTAGTGPVNLADEDTWPWQTVEMLRAKVPVSIDFINGAAGGYTSFESYGRLWSRLRFFHPDIVVVCHGWNEMYYFDRADSILSWRTLPGGSWSIGGDLPRPVRIYEPLWIDPLIRWSQLLTLVRTRFSHPIPLGEFGSSPEGPLRTDFDHDGVAIWRTNLILLREACNVLGARIFVVKQPSLVVEGLPGRLQSFCHCEWHGFDFQAHVRAYSAIYKVIDEEIPHESVIDLTPLSGDPSYFFDHVHPTPEGCHEIAGIVSDSLASYILGLGGDSLRP